MLPILLSTCVAVLQLGLGVLLLALARAPGWRGARVFSVIAISAAGYSASNITSALFALPDALRLAGGRLSFLTAAVFVAAWLVHAFGDRDGTLRSLPRWVGAMGALVLLSGLVAVATPWAYEPGSFRDITVGWANARYRVARPSALGEAIAWLYLAGVTVACARVLSRGGARRRRRWGYGAGFVVFLIASTVEVLVTNGVIEFLFIADVGFLALVIPMAAETVRRFVEATRELAASQTQLTQEIEIRTHERDEAQHAWLEAERSAAMGRLAAGVGHEINNPLAYLRLNLELLDEWGRTHQAPADFHESVESALDGADRIRRVIDALRTYARPGTGECLPFSLQAATEAAIGITAHQLRTAAPVELTSEPAPSVMGEEPKMVQVMTNLLLNAGQAIAELGAVRQGRIRVRVGTATDGAAVVEVADNGPGISRDDLRRLTQPYFTTRANAGAMGLGLFLARGVVEQHRGALEIESVLGEGTRVRVRLPAADAQATDSALESLAGRLPTPARARVGLSSARGRVAAH